MRNVRHHNICANNGKHLVQEKDMNYSINLQLQPEQTSSNENIVHGIRAQVQTTTAKQPDFVIFLSNSIRQA